MNMPSTLDQKLGLIVGKALAPRFKGLGFKKSGLALLRREPTLTWMLVFQKSRWNEPEQGQVTLNCGVYVPGLPSLYANKKEPGTPRLEDCAVYARIGMLTDRYLDIWWTIDGRHQDDSVDQIGKDIAEAIERSALPFLARFRELSDIAEFLRCTSEEYRYVMPMAEGQRLAYSAVVSCLTDDSSNAARSLEAAEQASAKTPLAPTVAVLRERLRNRFGLNVGGIAE